MAAHSPHPTRVRERSAHGHKHGFFVFGTVHTHGSQRRSRWCERSSNQQATIRPVSHQTYREGFVCWSQATLDLREVEFLDLYELGWPLLSHELTESSFGDTLQSRNLSEMTLLTAAPRMLHVTAGSVAGILG